MADHFINRSESKLRHDGAKFVGDVIEEIDNVFWGALKLLAQLRILSCNPDRASIELWFTSAKFKWMVMTTYVAFSHHDTPHRNEGRRGKPPFFSAEEAGNGDISASSQLAVGLDYDTPS